MPSLVPMSYRNLENTEQPLPYYLQSGATASLFAAFGSDTCSHNNSAGLYSFEKISKYYSTTFHNNYY